MKITKNIITMEITGDIVTVENYKEIRYYRKLQGNTIIIKKYYNNVKITKKIPLLWKLQENTIIIKNIIIM